MEPFDSGKHFVRCVCVRPGELSGGEPDVTNRADYIQREDGSWALRSCRQCLGLGVLVRPRERRDVRCVCVRQLIEVPPDDRAAYVEVQDHAGEWARRDCLCSGEGVDPRLFYLWELVDDASQLLDLYQQREVELERHILQLSAKIEGRSAPAADAEYVRGIDGP